MCACNGTSFMLAPFRPVFHLLVSYVHSLIILVVLQIDRTRVSLCNSRRPHLSLSVPHVVHCCPLPFDLESVAFVREFISELFHPSTQ